MKKQNLDQRTYELSEKTLTSELVYRGRFLQITRDQVELPDQSKSYREYFLHPGASLIIPILDNGKIIMIEQYRHAMKRVFLEFPAGKKDKNENFEQSAVRELKEETGYVAKSMRLLTAIHPAIGYANEEIQIFLAQNLSHTGRQLDPGEFLNLVEIDVGDLEKKVKAGDVSDVKTQIAFFWLLRVLNSGW